MSGGIAAGDRQDRRMRNQIHVECVLQRVNIVKLDSIFSLPVGEGDRCTGEVEAVDTDVWSDRQRCRLLDIPERRGDSRKNR